MRVVVLCRAQQRDIWRALIEVLGCLLKKAAMTRTGDCLAAGRWGRFVSTMKSPRACLKKVVLDGIAERKSPLEQLTGRQREILRLIAEGQNTKQMAHL